MYMYQHKAVPQVQSVLAKIELCRTQALGGHKYHCPGCDFELPVYNSCRDRHCPLCRGGRRADWLDKTLELLLPGVNYFQIVFTLPSSLASFALGNRRSMFGLLMRAAWQGLDELLRETCGVAPAATMVLHTWNQILGFHPHVHALVPGSFPSLDGRQWITPKHPKHKRRRKPYLCDNFELSARFREKLIAGLRRLQRRGELKFESEEDAEPAAFEAWLTELEQVDWNVYIQGPPNQQSDPSQVAKYLARYMTGGPISDSRLISYDGDEVWFRVRSRKKKQRKKKHTYPFRLNGRQFVNHWAQHILPKGFTKCRNYGGYHNTKRADYLQLCRGLLRLGAAEATLPSQLPPSEDDPPTVAERKCPRCEAAMIQLSETARESWGKILDGPHRPDWYHAFGLWDREAIHWYRDGY